MKTGWRFGNLLGIPFYIDYSWLPIAGLMTFSYSVNLATAYPSLSPLAAAVGGLLMALGLFGSVVAHELAHSLVARSQGIQVNSITLFIFGGMASLDRDARHAWGAFWVAIAGPALSLSLGAMLLILSLWAMDTPLGASLGYLASVNLVIGFFNLMPGLPLDGGQILRAIVWGRTRDPQKGMRWAARSGQWIGYAFVGLGGYWLFLRGSLSGLWLLLMGLFILNSARNYMQYTQLQTALLTLKAKEIMTRRFRVVDAGMSVREFVDRYLILAEKSEVYFAESDGRYRGLVHSERLRTLDRSEWEQRTLETLVEPLGEVPSVSEEAPLLEAVYILVKQKLPRVVVVTATGSVAGILDKGDIIGGLARYLGVTLPVEVLDRIRERNEFPPGFQLEALAERLYQERQELLTP
ncbi:MAG: site-2 protease family protein [Thermostichales cyanobacterium SZTDM-1c_bins_54]